MQDRYFKRSQCLQIIFWLIGIFYSLLLCEAVNFQQLFPVIARTFSLALSSWPTGKIADGRLGINAAYFSRVSFSPCIYIQCSPAYTLQRNLRREALFRHEE